ncbi:MAG: hypothetical protein J6Y02_07970 [Pseudobutyrivibrio sp.]|nr:hypothetical protein [Pseudobutyrivibrio sp.]
MKKRKFSILLVSIIGLMTVISGCGEKKSDSVADNESQVEVVKEEKKTFGERTAAEYPISEESQAKLDALETDYSKVNWDVEYEPESGIVVSEEVFGRDNDLKQEETHLAIAFTNLTDENVKISIEGYVENENGEVVYDLVEDDIEIWANNTVAREMNLRQEIPSGNIKWNSITITPLDKEYVPYEQASVLKKTENDYYCIYADYTSEVELLADNPVGLVLDKDGNAIGGGSESSGTIAMYNCKTFDGENADVVYFGNAEKRW